MVQRLSSTGFRPQSFWKDVKILRDTFCCLALSHRQNVKMVNSMNLTACFLVFFSLSKPLPPPPLIQMNPCHFSFCSTASGTYLLNFQGSAKPYFLLSHTQHVKQALKIKLSFSCSASLNKSLLVRCLLHFPKHNFPEVDCNPSRVRTNKGNTHEH